MKVPPPHPNPDSPHFLQFLLPWGYFVLHFGRCWFVRQWVSFGLGAPRGSSHALTPGEDLHNCFGNLHIAKPSNILHMLEILET